MNEEFPPVMMSKATVKWINRKGISEAKRRQLRKKKQNFHDVFAIKKD